MKSYTSTTLLPFYSVWFPSFLSTTHPRKHACVAGRFSPRSALLRFNDRAAVVRGQGEREHLVLNAPRQFASFLYTVKSSNERETGNFSTYLRIAA